MDYLLHQFAPFCFSLMIVIVLIPVWISICKKWHLFDEPDDRKHHHPMTPSMGGIAIFAGLFISFLSFAVIDDADRLRYLFGASLILFFTGFFDDMMTVPARNKLLLQAASAIIVFAGGYRIETLNGILGIYEIPFFLQAPLTVMLVVAFTNAFNFIDGIDGLAASLGLAFTITMGLLFIDYAKYDYAMLCFCMCGALSGFLMYNIHPAKIFMGDTGSLIIGFVSAVLFIELFDAGVAVKTVAAGNPARVMAIAFIPLFDITRTLVIRYLNGKSPFQPDRNHLHHLILKFGFGHTSSTFLIVFAALVVIIIQRLVPAIDPLLFIFVATAVSLLIMNSHTIRLLVKLRSTIQPGWGEKQQRIIS